MTNLNLKSRNELPLLLNDLNLKGCGVEIGTQTGLFSEVILNKSNLAILWSIDCWKHQDNYKDIANRSNLRQNYYKLKTKLRLKKFGRRSKILKAYSKDIPIKYNFLRELDFVYIDGDHSFEGCNLDLNIFYPRVKKDGILAGHDYTNYDDGKTLVGVKKAVDEFMKGKERLHIIKEERGNPSWFIVKE